MKRRLFFKNLFATGVVATIPESIGSMANQVEEKATEPVVEQNEKIPTLGGQEIRLYDENNKLAAYSYICSISSYRREIIDVTSLDSPDGYREFITGIPSWKITMENVTFCISTNKFFDNTKKYKMVMLDHTIPIGFIGDVVITGFESPDYKNKADPPYTVLNRVHAQSVGAVGIYTNNLHLL